MKYVVIIKSELGRWEDDHIVKRVEFDTLEEAEEYSDNEGFSILRGLWEYPADDFMVIDTVD